MKTKQVITHITDWLSDYKAKSGLKGFVLGVSGGIDSAVTSTLAAKTGFEVLVIEMPIHQPKDQITRAKNHMNWLCKNFDNVKQLSVNLTETFDTFQNEVNPNTDLHQVNLSLANTRSRLRMVTLYYYGQINNLLVTGTGNKVEDFGVGFYTKYGDGGVDISPIADLLKSEVFAIAKELNIIESIQVAKPTDGLWNDDRSDEDQIGATYDELEWAMEKIKSDNLDGLSERELEVIGIYNKFNRAAQHKMNPIPVCLIPNELK